MGIIFRAFNNVLCLAGKGNNRPLPAILTRFAIYGCRYVHVALHKIIYVVLFLLVVGKKEKN
jgi:hypothetical protein